MDQADAQARFEQAVMPYLDAAYNLARWLTGNSHDADDIVQEACLRAMRSMDGYRGGGRAWLLTIVRNTGYTWLRQSRGSQAATGMDEEIAGVLSSSPAPDAALIGDADRQLLEQAMEQLPAEFREILVLREQEEMSYKEIAEITKVPVGTVMSRLARARRQLQQLLTQETQRGTP